MNNILDELSILPENYRELNTAIKQIKEGVKKEGVSALRVKAQLKYMELMIKRVKDIVDKAALEEADSYGDEAFNKYGFEIQKSENATNYNYDNCGDPELDLYLEKEAILKRDKEARQNFLKSLKEKFVMIDEKTGDIHELYPPVKTSTTGLKFTLKK